MCRRKSKGGKVVRQHESTHLSGLRRSKSSHILPSILPCSSKAAFSSFNWSLQLNPHGTSHGLASSFFFLSDERKACQLPYPKLCRQPWDCQYSNNSSTALFLGEKQHINPAEIGQRMQRTLVSLLIIAPSTASLENTVVFYFLYQASSMGSAFKRQPLKKKKRH